eukprot:1444158-Amphidinium_carterae.1
MSKGSDGLTPWHKVTGKAYTQPLLPFAETCSWQELGKKRSDLGDRWTDGVFLGVMDNANEQPVAVPAGVRRVRAVRRKQAEIDGIVPVHSVGLTVEEPETSSTAEDLRHDGGTFCDEITGLPLSAHGVHKARAEEMQYMRDLQ